MIQGIRDLIHAADFVPFEIHLKGGKTYVVATRDYAWVSPAGMVHVVLGPPWRSVIINPTEIETVNHQGV